MTKINAMKDNKSDTITIKTTTFVVVMMVIPISDKIKSTNYLFKMFLIKNIYLRSF